MQTKDYMNKNLKTDNVILNELNKNYNVYSRGTITISKEENTYDVYILTKNGIDFYFTVTITPSKNEEVFFNGQCYTNSNELIKVVDEYNKTLPFPSRMYDPMYPKWAQEQSKINWFLTEKIGHNKIKNPHLVFLIEMDYQKNRDNKDAGSGHIICYINNHKWLKCNFDDAEDAVSKIIDAKIRHSWIVRNCLKQMKHTVLI